MTKYYYYAPTDESIQRSDFPDIGKKALGRLTVTENPAAEANSLKYATVTDSLKGRNIPYFGNCLRAPDNEAEMSTFSAIHNEADQGIEKRKEGSCKYLMKLESEWENYEIGQNFLSFPDDIKGQQSGITMTSMLFCRHGGFIYPVTSGQTTEETMLTEEAMTIEDALFKMTLYLRGENISEEELNEIIEYVAEHCGLKVNDMIQGQFSKEADENAHNRSMAYDSQIIAWTYYWNKKIESEFTYQFEIDPNIVKAMIAQESSFGSDAINKAKNPTRNVMQSLSTGNSTVWIAAGINPYDNNMFKVGDNISYKMLDGTIGVDGSLARDNLPIFTQDDLEHERTKMHFEGFDRLKEIFEVDIDGKYIAVFENVTSNMSIATGVGLLAYKIECDKDIYTGVGNYNTEGGYVSKINRG